VSFPRTGLIALVLLLNTVGIAARAPVVAASMANPQHRSESPSSAKAPSLDFVGVAEDQLKDPQFPAAWAKMKLVKEAGFNAARITVRWSPGDITLSEYDRAGVCNAAKAAHEFGIRLFVTVIPDPEHPPERSNQIKKINMYMGSMLSRLAGPGGCSPRVHRYFLEVWNEPNLATFVRRQYDARGERVSAWIYTRALASAYRSLKRDAARLGVEVTVIGGALASGHDPVNFLNAMGRARRALRRMGMTKPLMDMFSYHPYEDDSDVEPGDRESRGFTSHGNVSRAVRRNLGPIPTLYSEFGVESKTPAIRAWMYTGFNPRGVSTVSEALQARHYQTSFVLSASRGVKGLFVFLLFDECDQRDWQSGLYYCTDQGLFWPKASLGLLSPTLQSLSATTGTR
jgi:hypothetical protein